MPGFEVFGSEEREALIQIFDLNGGILFAHAFDAMRNGVYRVREFERAFAKYMGLPYAQAVSSGTAAVKVGLKALGVKAGDEVITTAFTFVATVEAILDCGAKPVIVDINESLNIDPQAVAAAVSPKTKAVVVVHMLGAPAQMDEIMAVAREHNLLVLEDTAQACGGSYKGRKLGTIGHVGTFSFDFGKTMTTGEGGMVITRDEKTALRAKHYHDHGHDNDPNTPRGQEIAQMTGFNYRMTELQGALGLVQLGKLDSILERHRENKHHLKIRLLDLPFNFRGVPDEDGDICDAFIFFAKSKKQAEAIAVEFAAEGIGTKILPDAMRWHFAKYWRHMFEEYGFYQDTWTTQWSRSEAILERAIALPIMIKMTGERIEWLADRLLLLSQKSI